MVDWSTAAPDAVSYLDAAAATTAGRRYKRKLLDALDVRAGHTVLDVGCGPGTDLARLAEAVGPAGTVIGVDHDPAMVAEARRRLADRANVEVRCVDAAALGLSDGGVDRARTDRVMQHLADPARVLGELRRVIRRGGVLGMAEPDWDTLVIDDADVETARAFTRFLATRVRNAVIGRQLARLAAAAGFDVESVLVTPVLFRRFDAAEQVLGLRRNTGRAVHAGHLAPVPARQWLDRLGTGHFLASFTLFTVTARARP